MSKQKKRTSAAIVGLLDAIKAEGLLPVEDNNDIKHISKLDLYEKPAIKETRTTSLDSISFEIKKLNTDNVHPWKMANRLQNYINDKSCEVLIDSLKSVGQQIPALVRPSTDGLSYELICGARRLYCCKRLNIGLLAAVVTLNDKEALLAMDAENRPREDISPYERALDYKRWLNEGVYKNYTEIYQAIGMKKSLFTQIISLSDIDPIIIKAFQHPSNLKIRWGYQIARYCKNPENKSLLINEAKKLCVLNLATEKIYKHMINSIKQSQQDKDKTTKLFISKDKTIKLQLVTQNNATSIKLNTLSNNDKTHSLIKEIVEIFELNEYEAEKV